MTTSVSRPRSVTAAFWLWLVSAILLVAYGLFVVTVRIAGFPAFLRLSGIVLMIAGLALGYLAGRSRQGDSRFKRAAVALSMALVVFLSVLLAIRLFGVIVAPIVVCLIVAAGLVTRSAAATAWFAAGAQQEKSDG
jgi:uncharacterized membrane protein HdeD (DUF308 family)